MSKFKQILKKLLPDNWIRIGGLVLREFKVIKNLGILRLLNLYFKKTEEQKIKQNYKPVLFEIDKSYEEYSSEDKLFKGFFSTYYRPESKLVNEILVSYPLLNSFGIKVFEHADDFTTTTVPKNESFILHEIGESLSDQINTYSIFNYLGIGPDVYDIVCLKFGCGTLKYGLIVEHIPLDCNRIEFNIIISKIKGLIEDNKITNLTYNNNDDFDFDFDYGRSNVKKRIDGSLVCVDLNNFKINKKKYAYEEISSELKDTHFGDNSVLLGDRYLYQSIPNIAVGGKRDTDLRRTKLSGLLSNNIGSLDFYTVLDVGCNLGQMFQMYQDLGADWVIGFDMPEYIEVTDKLLKIQAVIKKSLYGFDICNPDISAVQCIDKIRNKNNILISYLSIVKHIGWPEFIFRKLIWSYMLFEAHENDGPDEIDVYFSNLKKFTTFEILEKIQVKDGTSNVRSVYLLKNTGRIN